jgi:hypothetical protein
MSNGEVDEGELTESPDDPNEEEKDLDDLSRDVYDAFSKTRQQTLDGTLRATSKLPKGFQYQSVSLENAFTRFLYNEFEIEIFRDDGERQLLGRLRDAATQSLQSTGNAPADQGYNLGRFFASMLGMNVPDAARVVSYDLLVRTMTDVDTAEINVRQEIKNSILVIASQLKGETSADYWFRMIKFCNGKSLPTALDMICFMQYTKELFPLTSQYTWSSYKADVVGQLIALGSKGGPGMVFSTTTPYFDYGTLPRAVAADCFALAFSGIANNISK